MRIIDCNRCYVDNITMTDEIEQILERTKECHSEKIVCIKDNVEFIQSFDGQTFLMFGKLKDLRKVWKCRS